MNYIMKQLTISLSLLIIACAALAQAPQNFSYQAIVRNSSNAVVANATVGIKILILQGANNGPAIFSESHLTNTDANGLANILVGTGTPIIGLLSTINWSTGPFFLKTQTDPNGGTSYTVTSTKQLMSAPFALYAHQGGNVTFPSATTGELLQYQGSNWVANSLVVGISGSNIPVSTMQPSLVMNYCMALSGIYPSRNGDEPFLGHIALYAFGFAPRFWAQCNGQLLPIAQNQALFSLLGTQFGGNGTTNFALPNLQSRGAMHSGQGPGLTNRNIGEMLGSESITLIGSNIPAHNHTITVQ
jgi:microcystin-dependent protein